MLLGEDRCRDIALIARNHIEGFLEAYVEKGYKLGDLACNTGIGISPIVRDLFTYTTEIKAGEFGYIWIESLADVNARWHNPPGKGSAAAWLIKWMGPPGFGGKGAPTTGAPTAIIDRNYVNSSLKMPASHCFRTLNRIVLHEVGHVVLHWNALQPPNPGPASSASSVHEIEAWYFASQLLGLSFGAHSYDTRHAGVGDISWMYV